MARIFVLDSGPLGLLVGDRHRDEVSSFISWCWIAYSNAALIVIPEMADYEVRRELLRADKTASLLRLDRFAKIWIYLPLSTEAMRLAAELWSEGRKVGKPTADDKAIDGDVIVAAQALRFAAPEDQLIVITDNSAHLGNYVASSPYRAIMP